jgi:hypothetical protein
VDDGALLNKKMEIMQNSTSIWRQVKYKTALNFNSEFEKGWLFEA